MTLAIDPAPPPPASAAPGVDPFRTLARAFEEVPDEVDVTLRPSEGAIPDALRGTLFRNGPGRLSMGGVRYGHPFDGDGHVQRFRFESGAVRYRNRFVRTRELEAELRAGRMLFRAFGTNLPGGLRRNALRMRFKNAANTAVLWHAGRLYALWEGGLPHRLDPDSLETLARDDLGGVLRARDPLGRVLAPELPFSAHPSLDPETGELWNFGALLGARPKLLVFRFDARGRLLARRDVVLERLAFVHDFVLTRKYAVFFLAPLSFDVPRALLGLRTPVDALRADPDGASAVLVVPRDGGPVRTIPAPAGFVFHHLGGHDDGDAIVVDSLRMDRFEGGSVSLDDPAALRGLRVPPACPTRTCIDLRSGVVESETRIDAACELPSTDPRRRTRARRFAWAIHRPAGWSAPTHTAIARLDLERRDVLTRDFAPDLPGEPLFVPRPAVGSGTGADGAESDGWLLVEMYEAVPHRSALYVLDASTLATLARVPLPHHVPPGFHGTFVPA